MANISQVAVLPTTDVLNTRLSILCVELVHAWDHSDSNLLRQWSLGAAKIFGTALTRRAKNFLSLLASVGKGSWDEGANAVDAFRANRLGDHLGARAAAAYSSGVDFTANARLTAEQTVSLLRTRPREAIPQLLILVATSLLVSGGPDGDGGAPDLDLMSGIGAHRSPLTHSVLMGAALETSFLSLVHFVQLVHANLPQVHDPIWDNLCTQADAIARAASTGASIGMSYHLLVDGLIQPSAYHGLVVPLPMEAHQGIAIANGIVEGMDARHKPAAR